MNDKEISFIIMLSRRQPKLNTIRNSSLEKQHRASNNIMFVS